MKRLPATSYTHFKRLRFLALSAFACSLALSLALWIVSLTPGDKSATQTSTVSNTIKDTFEIEETNGTLPTKIICTLKDNPDGAPYYSGESVDINLAFLPSTATENAVTFHSDKSAVAFVSVDGNLFFRAKGKAVITVASAVNPNVFTKIPVECLGIKPDFLENLRFDVPDSMGAGENVDIALTSDAGALLLSVFEVSVEGEAACMNTALTVLYGLSAGEVTLTAVTLDGDVRVQKTITVTENGFIMPTALVATDSATIDYGKYYYPTVTSAPVGSPSAYTIVSSNPKVGTVFKNTVRAAGVGECTLTLTSVYDPTVKKTILFTVPEVTPTALSIVGSNRAMVNAYKRFYVSFENVPTAKKINWTVVSGKATIDESGCLLASKIGNVTIRATSASDPSVYDEMTVKVTLYDTFYMFVRKILGHFSLFALLGFGLTFTFLLLGKPRKLAPLYALSSGFIVSGFSEMFQLPAFTTGRYATWTDVGIDTLGVFSGIIIAAVIISLTCLIWRKVNRDGFDRMINAYRDLNFKSALKKSTKNKN